VCEGHNCAGTHSTIGHAAAAATTEKSFGIPLIVVVPHTPTPSEIDAYNWHWWICLVRCDVKFNGTPSGPGIHRGSGHHYGSHRHRQRKRGVQWVERGVRTDPGGIDACSAVLPTDPRGADGLRVPTTNYRPTAADYRPTNETVPAQAVRPNRARTTDAGTEQPAGRRLEENDSSRYQRGASARTGQYDPGRRTIWRGSPQCEDAVRECLDVSSQGGPGHSPGSRRQRLEISRLLRLFRVGSNSVERLDCSTPNGHTTQTRQLS
jgi:hypothetical protein